MGKVYHVNTNQNKAEMAIFTLEKIEFRVNGIPKDIKCHFLMMKEPVHQKGVKILNIMHLLTEL